MASFATCMSYESACAPVNVFATTAHRDAHPCVSFAPFLAEKSISIMFPGESTACVDVAAGLGAGVC